MSVEHKKGPDAARATKTTQIATGVAGKAHGKEIKQKQHEAAGKHISNSPGTGSHTTNVGHTAQRHPSANSPRAGSVEQHVQAKTASGAQGKAHGKEGQQSWDEKTIGMLGAFTNVTGAISKAEESVLKITGHFKNATPPTKALKSSQESSQQHANTHRDQGHDVGSKTAGQVTIVQVGHDEDEIATRLDSAQIYREEQEYEDMERERPTLVQEEMTAAAENRYEEYERDEDRPETLQTQFTINNTVEADEPRVEDQPGQCNNADEGNSDNGDDDDGGNDGDDDNGDYGDDSNNDVDNPESGGIGSVPSSGVGCDDPDNGGGDGDGSDPDDGGDGNSPDNTDSDNGN